MGRHVGKTLFARNRVFSLGPQKVSEKLSYDHVGVKNCLFGDFTERVEERLSKGRRCFNALCSLGIKKSGITMRTCTTLFWSIIIHSHISRMYQSSTIGRI